MTEELVTNQNIEILDVDGKRSCLFIPISGDYRVAIYSPRFTAIGFPVDSERHGLESIEILGSVTLKVGELLNSYHSDLPEKPILAIESVGVHTHLKY